MSLLCSLTSLSLSISEWCCLFDIHAYVTRAFSCASHRVMLLAAGLQELKGSSVKRLLVTSEALKPLAANCALEAVLCRLRNLPDLRGRSRRLGRRAISNYWCIIPWFLDSHPASLNPAKPYPNWRLTLCNSASIAFVGLVLPEFWFRRGFSCGA